MKFTAYNHSVEQLRDPRATIKQDGEAFAARGALAAKISKGVQAGAEWAIQRSPDSAAAVAETFRRALDAIGENLPIDFGSDPGVRKSASPWDGIAFQLYWKQIDENTFVFDVAQLLVDLSGRATTADALR
jgi:hypothetical protein